MLKTTTFIMAMGLLVYGQVAPSGMPLSEWSHIPAVGLLMFLLYWIVVKQQPKERREAREHMERVVDKLGNYIKETQQQQHESSSEIANKIALLADNCRTHLDRTQ